MLLTFPTAALLLAVTGLLKKTAPCWRTGWTKVEAFFVPPFQGVLALFLLEMDAGRRLIDLKKPGLFLLIMGITLSIVHRVLGALLGKLVGLSLGSSATMMAVIGSSASYNAAQAAVRLSLREANSALYLTSSLAITFLFNITLEIPIYYAVAPRLFE